MFSINDVIICQSDSQCLVIVEGSELLSLVEGIELVIKGNNVATLGSSFEAPSTLIFASSTSL